VISRRTRAQIATLIALPLALAPTVAQAGGKTDDGASLGDAQGGRKGQNITVRTKVRTTVNGASSTARTGSLSSSDSNWTPPACWYEPAFSPKEIEATVKAWRGMDGIAFLDGIGDIIGEALDQRYKAGHPYKNYNLDKQGEGMFWAAAVNPNRKDEPAANSCDKPPFWVDEGKPPNEPLAVSPKVLAEYAYDELPVPGTEIEMAPAGRSTVNLPTWIWLDKATFKKTSVTASLPGTGLSATTTAEPVSLHIDPGTADAQTYPASGDCTINDDGSIGEPYAQGKAAKTPPCGVSYLRATGSDGAYPLQATVTWKISWTSTNGEGGGLPDGTFGTTQDVTVQEIQSVNR
jgi:enoyl reductase